MKIQRELAVGVSLLSSREAGILGQVEQKYLGLPKTWQGETSCSQGKLWDKGRGQLRVCRFLCWAEGEVSARPLAQLEAPFSSFSLTDCCKLS